MLVRQDLAVATGRGELVPGERLVVRGVVDGEVAGGAGALAAAADALGAEAADGVAVLGGRGRGGDCSQELDDSLSLHDDGRGRL